MAVAQFRKALNSLTVADFNHIDTLSSEFSAHKNFLKKQNTEIKRILTAIFKLKSDFILNNHTIEELKQILIEMTASNKQKKYKNKLEDKLQKQNDKKEFNVKLKEQTDIDKYITEISKYSKSSGKIIDIPSNSSSKQLKEILNKEKTHISELAKQNILRQNIILKIIEYQPDFSKYTMISYDSLKTILIDVRDKFNTQKTLNKKIDNKINQIVALQSSFDFDSIDTSSFETLHSVYDTLKKNISLQKKESKILENLQIKINKLNSDFDYSKYDTSDKLQNAYNEEIYRLKQFKETNKQILAEQKKNEPKVAKNKFYQNYLSWLQTEFDEDHIKTHGGPRKFASLKWAILSDEQKKDPSAQWNIHNTHKSKTVESDDDFA